MKITAMNNMKKLSATLIFLTVCLSIGCKQERKLPDPLEAGWKGEKVCEVLFENDEMRVLKCTFPPGVGHEKHSHDPHFGYTIKGSKFRMTNDSGAVREVNVPTGSSFDNAKRITHEVLNIGDSTGVFLIVEHK